MIWSGKLRVLGWLTEPELTFTVATVAGVLTLVLLLRVLALPLAVSTAGASIVALAVIVALSLIRHRVVMHLYEKLDLNIAAVGYLAEKMPEFLDMPVDEQKRLVVEAMDMLAGKLMRGSLSLEDYERYLERGRELLRLYTVSSGERQREVEKTV